MDKTKVIKALPKIDQHIHLVGSIKPKTLLWLAENGDFDSPFTNLDEIKKYFMYKGFEHFIEVYSMVNDHITDEGQYEIIAFEMLEEEARSNVKHVECLFSALDHVRRGLDYGKMLDAINKGLKRGYRMFGISSNIRVDLVRNYGPDKGMEVLDLVEEKRENLVAVDLGGSEYGFPAGPYKSVYQRAEEMGLHKVVHAGEAAGSDSIWQALEIGAERIGHGVAAIDDPELMNYLKLHRIPIECCPTSNIRTGAVGHIGIHPIREFYDEGIIVTVNTDDPSMFNTDMNREYIELNKHLGFSIPQLYQLSINALETAFINDVRRVEMKKEFDREYKQVFSSK